MYVMCNLLPPVCAVCGDVSRWEAHARPEVGRQRDQPGQGSQWKQPHTGQ